MEEMEKDLKLLAAYPDLNVNIRTKYYSDNIGLFWIIISSWNPVFDQKMSNSEHEKAHRVMALFKMKWKIK